MANLGSCQRCRRGNLAVESYDLDKAGDGNFDPRFQQDLCEGCREATERVFRIKRVGGSAKASPGLRTGPGGVYQRTVSEQAARIANSDP